MMTPAASTSFRLALFYAATFTTIGIHLPYWPVWLASRGLNASEIGALLAAAFAAKIVVNPLVGHIADRRGDRKRPLVVLSAAALCWFTLFPLADGFWPLLAVTLLFSGTIAATMPLGENLTMLTAQARGIDYGRIRLWGSLTFIAAAGMGGLMLDAAPPDRILAMVLVSLVLTVAACASVPDTRAPTGGSAPPPVKALLGHPTFIAFLAATSLVQVSHMIYYGFSTLHWQAAGLSGLTIGWLWAEGVIAEVALFAMSGRVVARFGPARLILFGAATGVVRWLALALTTDPILLSAVQWLHALTFGACHLGAMHFIQRAAPPGLSARAQGLYSSLTMGLAPGIAMLLSGRLYEAAGGTAFLVMSLCALLGAVVAARLGRVWDGAALR